MLYIYTPDPRRGRGVYCFTSVRLSIQDIFLDPSDSYFLFADFVDFSTHWTYMLIFRRISLNNYWWQRSDIWSQASYRYPISWEAFLDPSGSYFLFAKERGYHRWALAHSSSCWIIGNDHLLSTTRDHLIAYRINISYLLCMATRHQ